MPNDFFHYQASNLQYKLDPLSNQILMVEEGQTTAQVLTSADQVAAAAVEAADALDTTIQSFETLTAARGVAGEEAAGSREMVWTTAEGIEKRLVLPIEMIKEDMMEDPEHYMSTLERGDMNEQEFNKMVSAIQEMQGSMRGQSSSQRGDTSLTKKFDDSALRASDNDDIYIGENNDPGVSTSQPSLKATPTIETQKASGTAEQPLQTNSQVTPKASLEMPTAIQSKMGSRTQLSSKKASNKRPVKGKKQPKNTSARKNLSELQQATSALKTTAEEKESVTATEVPVEPDEPVDPAEIFERIKAQFYKPETQMNDPEQLRELERLELEREQQAELRKQKEEEEQRRQAYTVSADAPPSIAAITRILEDQERARRANRKKQRAEKLVKLKAEKAAEGLQLDEEEIKKIQEEEDEDIDYTVIMAEEENVPQGQFNNIEKEMDLQGKKMRQLVRQKGKLVKLMPDSTLPKTLPDNLVYWNRCETRIESQKLVTYSQIQNFQKAEIVQFEDKKSAEKVMTTFPIIDDLEMWADTEQQQYVNNHEKQIFNMRKFPPSMKEYGTEGFIKFERVSPFDCLFNSRFESGNLRQVFKVLKDHDFDMVPVDDEVPDYLPEELQQEKRQEIKELRIVVMKDRHEKHITEEKEDEVEMKLLPNQRKKTYGGAFEEIKKVKATTADDKDKDGGAKDEQKLNHDLEDLNSDGDKAEDKDPESDDEQMKKKKRKKAKKRENAKPTCEYNLYLQDDTNADSALFQWYYFSVMNIRQDTFMRINISNLSKPNGLYNKGMKPFVYSMRKFKQTGVGWHRGGENVAYFGNGHTARYSKKNLDAHWMSDGTVPVGKDNYKSLHSLSFDYRFESDYDVVFFAHFQPYTYTDLINYMCTIKANESHNNKMRMDHICNALGGAPMYGLTITNNIEKEYVSAGKEIFKYQRYEYKKAEVKPKKVKYLENTGKRRNRSNSDKKEAGDDSDGDHVSSSSSSLEEAEVVPQLVDPASTGAPVIVVQPLHGDGLAGQDDDSPLLARPKLDGTILAPDSNNVKTSDDQATTPRSQQRSRSLSRTIEKQKKKKAVAVKTDKEQLKVNQELFETQFSGRRGGEKQTGFLLPQDPNEGKDEKNYKKYVFITSRVHPGESQASHIVHGMINWLLSDDPEAEEIRDKFIVKIIPMLNPDGVIHGNYRVSLLGVDLNRRWKKPSKFLHPTVYYSKQIIKYFNDKGRQPGCESGGVVLSCDIHGHSRNMDLFTYNCTDEVSMNNLMIRAVPIGIDKRVPIFNLETCKFALEKDKGNTARVVLFKEVGILSSFTLECTYFGSEFLKRSKQGHFLLTKDQQDYQAERYNIGYSRKDIQIDENICLILGADVIKGINYASKKRPLLPYWFRNPPKNIIELFQPGGKGDSEIDPALLELEKAWKHIGTVQQDRHLGFGERFDERGEPIRDEAQTDKRKGRRIDLQDVALIDKLKKTKKGSGKKKKKQDGLGILTEKDGMEQGKKDYSNTDMVDILSPDPVINSSRLAKKKGKKQQQIRKGQTKQQAKRKNSSGTRLQQSDKTIKLKHQSTSDVQAALRSSAAGATNNKSIKSDDLSDAEVEQDQNSDGRQDSSSQKKLIPIVLREPGGSAEFNESEEDNEEINSELRTSQIIFSTGRGFNLQKKLRRVDDREGGGVQDSSEQEEHDEQIYLKSKELDSPSEQKLRIVMGLSANSDAANSIKRPTRVESGNARKFQTQSSTSKFAPAEQQSSFSSSKRQLNLSVRMKEGKASFKSAADAVEGQVLSPSRLPRIESQLETNSQEEDRIESRLIGQQPSFTQDFYQSRTLNKKEQVATNQLKELAEYALQQDQQKMIRNEMEQSKKNLFQQVSAEELDGEDFSRSGDFHMDDNSIVVDENASAFQGVGSQERMRKTELQSRNSALAEEALIGRNVFRKNKLSVDPIVLPTSKLEKVSQIQMKTMERENSRQFLSLRSPQRTKRPSDMKKKRGSPGKFVFAPQNGVYNQSQLLQNPDLAKQQNINFMVQAAQPEPPSLICNKHSQISLKHHHSLKSKNSRNPQYGYGGPAVIPQSFTAQKIDLTSPRGVQSLMQGNMSSRQQHHSHALRSKKSMGSLLKRSQEMDHNQFSSATLQSAIAPSAINDYVNEHVSLMEKTKIKVAAKRKKRQQHLHKGVKNAALMSGGMVDHSETLSLPRIKDGKSPTALRRDTMALDGLQDQHASSMIDLGFIQQPHVTTDVIILKPNTTYDQRANTRNISELDGQLLELPPLSPSAILQQSQEGASSMMMTVPTKKYLQVKNGFDFANDMGDRQLERIMDLKLTSTLRERERRKSRPQFVIKPLDQREFLKIQLQYVETANSDKLAKPKKGSAMGSMMDIRRSSDAVQQSPNIKSKNSKQQIKVLDGGLKSPTTINFINSLDQFDQQMNTPTMSPVAKRSLSMNNQHLSARTNHSPNHFSEQKLSHPALLMHGQAAMPQFTAAKAAHRRDIREREDKTVAVQRLVNQTVVSNNKVMMFKPNQK